MRDKYGIIAQLIDDFLNGSLSHPFTLFSNRIADNFKKTGKVTPVYDLMTFALAYSRPEDGSIYTQLLNFLKSGIGHAVPSLNAPTGTLDDMMEKLTTLTTPSRDYRNYPDGDYWNQFEVMLDDDFYNWLATEIKRREHMGIPVVRHDWRMDELPVNPLPKTIPLEKKKIELSIKVNGFDVTLPEVRVLHQALKSHIEYIDGVGKEAVAVMEKFGFTNQYEEMHEFVLQMQTALDGLLDQKRIGKLPERYVEPGETDDPTAPNRVTYAGHLDLEEFMHEDYAKVLFTEYPHGTTQPIVQRILYRLTNMDVSIELTAHAEFGKSISKMVKDGVIELGAGNEQYRQVMRLTEEFRAVLDRHTRKTNTELGYAKVVRDRLDMYTINPLIGKFS